MTSFDWIALIGACAWLPPIFMFFKEQFAKAQVRIITEKKVELGFTTFGPILNLRVAFAVKKKDIVISGIKIRLKHEGGEEKIFTWQGVIQKMLQINNPQTGPIPFEKEISVLAIKLSPKEVEERFIRFQDENYHIAKEVNESKAAKRLIYLQEAANLDYDKFLQSQEMKDLYSFIKQAFNWKGGKYSMIFEIESPERFVLQDETYSLELNTMDIEFLEKNKGIVERSYEYEIKPKKENEERPPLVWAWRYPLLKCTK